MNIPVMRSIGVRAGLALTCLILGCGFPRPPQTITVSNPPAMRPSKPSDVKSPVEAMATIMTVCREDLRLPVVDPIQLLLYKNTASFASYGEGWTTLPIDVDTIIAFAEKGKIHINLEKTHEKKWGTLVDLLAHEYGHAIQAVVSNRQMPRWFSEGFATWVTAKVVQSLGWQDYDLALERAKLELINNRHILPGLEGLDWEWQALSEMPNGHIRTYVLAFIAVERLIHMGGFPATMQYVKSADFKKSFQFSWEDFKADVERYISSLTPAKNADGTVMQKPEWKVGDQWTYAVKHPGDKPSTTKKIVREDRFEGKISYVVRAEERELFYSKETLELLAATKEGKVTSKRYDPSHDFSWPLTLGKQWKNTYAWEDFANGGKHKIVHSMVVSEVEKVTVRAGTFLAAKIQGYDSRGGRLMWEYWYSPTTKWLVKLRDYSDIAFREEELTSFKIN